MEGPQVDSISRRKDISKSWSCGRGAGARYSTSGIFAAGPLASAFYGSRSGHAMEHTEVDYLLGNGSCTTCLYTSSGRVCLCAGVSASNATVLREHIATQRRRLGVEMLYPRPVKPRPGGGCSEVPSRTSPGEESDPDVAIGRGNHRS